MTIYSNSPPNVVGAIIGRKNLAPGERYIIRSTSPGFIEEEFTFICDIDGIFFEFEGRMNNELQKHNGQIVKAKLYSDCGIEPYMDSKGNFLGWNKYHYVMSYRNFKMWSEIGKILEGKI
jgi:hypothetical protein